MRSKARPKGFTLIELTVVLLILGIALTVVVPGWIGPRRASDREVRAVVQRIEQAQRLAVERDRHVELHIVGMPPDFTLVERSTRGAQGDTLARGELWPDAAEPSNSPPLHWALTFDPRGRAYGDSLTFDRFPDRRAQLRVDRWTGGVRVFWSRSARVHPP